MFGAGMEQADELENSRLDVGCINRGAGCARNQHEVERAMKTKLQQYLAKANAKKGLLSPQQVWQIRDSLARGERPAVIALLYGVSEQTVTRIRDGKTWGWLGNPPQETEG